MGPLKPAVLVALLVALLAVSCAAQTEAFASDAIPPERLQQYSDLAVRWMQEYLRIDTTNPPGNEARAAEFFKRVLDAEGIETRTFEVAPGRANLWARLQAAQPQGRPIILLNHTDVVTSSAEHWRVPPFSGEVVDGAIYGRGAQDMKNEGLAQLVVMVMLKREKVPLSRDVIFLATIDEEAGSTGADWMLTQGRELLGNAEFLINEGGYNIEGAGGKVRSVAVDVAEKSPLWLRLTAEGEPGHGSIPRPDSAPDRLVRALARVIAYETELKLLPVVDQGLRRLAAGETGERARWFRNPRAAMNDARFRARIRRDNSFGYMFRNTIALTMLSGSEQTNVIPHEAWAQLDVRLLPGEDPEAFVRLMEKVVADPRVKVTRTQKFRVSNSSPTDTALFRAIEATSARYFDGAPVVPRLTSGYTENQRYREIGIHCYGFTPYRVSEEESRTEHGHNERVRVEQVRRAPRVLYDVVTAIASAPRL